MFGIGDMIGAVVQGQVVDRLGSRIGCVVNVLTIIIASGASFVQIHDNHYNCSEATNDSSRGGKATTYDEYHCSDDDEACTSDHPRQLCGRPDQRSSQNGHAGVRADAPAGASQRRADTAV